jgi:hypothetical protein
MPTIAFGSPTPLACGPADGQLHEVRRADGPVRIPDRFAFDTVGRRTWVISQNAVDVATDATARLVTRFVGSRGGVVTAIVVDSAGAAWYGKRS